MYRSCLYHNTPDKALFHIVDGISGKKKTVKLKDKVELGLAFKSRFERFFCFGL